MKKISCLFCVFAFLFCIASCNNETGTDANVGNIETTAETTVAETINEEVVEVVLPSADKELNGKGNKYLGGGFAVTDGEWIYYRSYSDGSYSIKKMSMDGSTVESLPGGDMRDLDLKDGWLYGSYKGRNIRRVDIADREEYKFHKTEDLNEYNSSDITIVDEWVYYCTNDTRIEQNGIYKMKLDGTENTLIYGGVVCDQLKFDGEWLYFSDSGFSHYRIKLDGTGLESLPTETFGYIVSNGTFYERDGKFNSLSEVKTSDSMVLVDDTLYFCGSKTIYKQNADGTDKTTVIEVESCSNLHVLGEWIFFYNQDAENWYFCKTDGSSLKVAE